MDISYYYIRNIKEETNGYKLLLYKLTCKVCIGVEVISAQSGVSKQHLLANTSHGVI